jgi:hypothetical protein
MSITQNNIAIRRVTGSALGVAACAVSSTAFAAQNLILAFGNGTAIPIGGWTTIAIALMIAACSLVLARRKGASRFAQWSLLIVTGGALSLIPPAPDADAGVGNLLVTSPFVITNVTCAFPSSTLVFQNGTGGTTTIQSVSLTGAVSCSLSPPATPAISQALPAAPLSFPQCTAGLQLANNASCTVTLFSLGD